VTTGRSSRSTAARSFLAIAALGLAVSLVTSSASATPAANDVGIQTGFGALGEIDVGKTTTPFTSFSFSVIVSGDSPAPVTVHLTIPQGLAMGAPVSGSAGSCTGTTELVCTGNITQDFNTSALWAWNVVASGPGSYSIGASVSSADADPNPSNNSVTFAFQVTAPSGGGGGGGGAGGGGGGAAVTVSGVKVSPASPRAGSPVTATVRVKRGGSAARPSRVGCAAKVGTAKAAGKGKTALGSAACTFKTRAAAKGKTLRGTMTVVVGGKSIRRTFSARFR
jgi:hypothetical protein